jgi:hypothetical protein
MRLMMWRAIAARPSLKELATLYRSVEPLDQRRSTGHLCACTAVDVEQVLGGVLSGAVRPTPFTFPRAPYAVHFSAQLSRFVTQATGRAPCSFPV